MILTNDSIRCFRITKKNTCSIQSPSHLSLAPLIQLVRGKIQGVIHILGLEEISKGSTSCLQPERNTNGERTVTRSTKNTTEHRPGRRTGVPKSVATSERGLVHGGDPGTCIIPILYSVVHLRGSLLG